MKSTYIGMTTRHMDARVKEHLHSKNTKSAIHNHIKDCTTCLETEYDLNNFQILRQCTTKYETKIQEALLIKKHNPTLNVQLYGRGTVLYNTHCTIMATKSKVSSEALKSELSLKPGLGSLCFRLLKNTKVANHHQI